jgi:ADP-ribosylglycohydrolase
VIPGQLLAGEHPGGDTAVATRARLKSLLDAGIDCFIDLTMPQELDAYDGALPPEAEYFRASILDHSVPALREDMSRVLDFVLRALSHGRHVYVHCRAGIGRTGTVIGCLLVEQGRSGDQALQELNQLWQTSARAKAWPFVPETDEQVEYVRNWSRHIPDTPALPPGTDDLKARFRGAFGGLAVGDALAAATQDQAPGSFAPVEQVVGGGPLGLPAGAWSDDTAMALCLAESLLERGGFDARDQMQRYGRWQQQGHLSATGQAVGITASTARALALAKWQRKLFSGSHDPAHVDPEPLSRVAAAVMFFYATPQIAIHQACEQARTTCQAPLVLDCCRLFAAILYAALAGRPKARSAEERKCPNRQRSARGAVGFSFDRHLPRGRTARRELGRHLGRHHECLRGARRCALRHQCDPRDVARHAGAKRTHRTLRRSLARHRDAWVS